MLEQNTEYEEYSSFDGISESYQQSNKFQELPFQRERDPNREGSKTENVFSNVLKKSDAEMSFKNRHYNQSFQQNLVTPSLGNSPESSVVGEQLFNQQIDLKQQRNALNLKEVAKKVQRDRSMSQDSMQQVHKKFQQKLPSFFKLQVVKEGYVEKKSANFFLGWQKRFLQLYDTKILYWRSANQRYRIQGCINFLNYKGSARIVNENIVQITLEGIKRVFEFKSNEAIQWLHAITCQIQKINDFQSPFPRILESQKKVYFKKDIVSEVEFLSLCESGDMLLMKSLKSGFFFSNSFDFLFLIYKQNNITYLCMRDKNNTIKLIQYEAFMDQFESSIEYSCLKRLHYVKKLQIHSFIENSLIATQDQSHLFCSFMLDKTINTNEKLIIFIYKKFQIFEKKTSDIPISKIKDVPYPTINGAWFSHLIVIFPKRHTMGFKQNTSFY